MEIKDTSLSFFLKIFGVCLFLGTLLLLLGLFLPNLNQSQQQSFYGFSGFFFVFVIVLIGMILGEYKSQLNLKEFTTILGTGKGKPENESLLFNLPRRKKETTTIFDDQVLDDLDFLRA